MTLGAELELQLVNRNTLDLSSSSLEVLKRVGNLNSVKAEIYQSMIEITSEVCQNAHEVGRDLRQALAKLLDVCDELDLGLVSAGTHPFAEYEEGKLFPEARYRRLLENHQWIAKRLLIFGLHVHIGMRSGEHAIRVANALLEYLPLLLSLSSSSPFCQSNDTQLASSRTTFFESLPTGGHPCTFSSWTEFKEIYEQMRLSGSIEGPKDLWWDIRPSPNLGTIEIRICDSPATIREAEALVALIHLLCQKIDGEIAMGKTFPPPPLWLLRENKWRAMRRGVGAQLIVAENGQTKSVQQVLSETLVDVSPLVDLHGYKEQMSLLEKIARQGASADRQRKRFEQTADFQGVLHSLMEELRTDSPSWNVGIKRKARSNAKKGGIQCA